MTNPLEALFPPHKASLTLEHNPHRACYETVAQWEDHQKACGNQDKETDPVKVGWVSAAERERSLQSGELWTLQWYPDTPVGFYSLYASDLGVLLKAAGEMP